jgi:hypothetical protein
MATTLANATILFRTHDEDKDHNTRLTVEVTDSESVVAARIENDFGRFPDQSDNGPFALVVKNPSTRESLQRGKFEIHIQPRGGLGHDTWRFTGYLDLLFGDGTHLQAVFNDLQLSQDNNEFVSGLSGILREKGA